MATRTRRSPARARHFRPVSRSPTSKPASAAATCRCRRSETASRWTASPGCCSRPTNDRARRSRALQGFGVEPQHYLVCTIHRQSNVQHDRLRRIVAGLNRLDEPIVFPAHPRTASVVSGLGPHVQLVAPLGYLDLSALAAQARVILTDSGGLQKEAYWYAVPCVTMRPSTEWVDTVELGANVLVDDDADRIVTAV